MAAQRPIDNPVRESVSVLARYAKGQLLVALVVTALYLIGFAIVQLPWWFLVALACGVLNLVPRFGSLLGLAVAGLVGFLGEMDLWHLAGVFLVWVVVQGLEGFWLTPWLVGESLGLKPLMVFLVMLGGGFLFGPLGFLLAVPVVAIAMIFWRYYQQPKPIVPGTVAEPLDRSRPPY